MAVPGNHELQRPQGLGELSFRVLEEYAQGRDDEDVRLLEEMLWEKRDSSFIKPLFANYQSWFQRRILPDLEKRARVNRSHFPGDFCLEVEPAGAFPLCLIGLNSTWQQYRGGDFERKLSLSGRQLQAALPAGGASPLEIFRRFPRALLMMHHPPSWLSPNGLKVFREFIYPPDRFDLCLHGHMHEGRTESVAISGSQPRYFFQAPSLFGLENWEGGQEKRLFGYAWGELSAEGEVRLWPLTYVRRGSGEGAFVHDHAFPEDAAGVLIRPLHAQPLAPAPASARSGPEGRLPPVLPVVLYNGDAPWRAARDVASLVEDGPAGLERYRPRLEYFLVDEGRIAGSELESLRNVAAALFRLERSQGPDDLKRVLEALQEWLNRPEHSELRRAFASWLRNVLLPMRMPGVEIPQVADLQEVKAMLADRVIEWTEEWKREGFEEGFGKGTEKGLEKGLRKGLRKGVEKARSEVRGVLVRHLEARFGPLSEEARGRLEAIDSLEALTEMMGRVPLVHSLDELGLG